MISNVGNASIPLARFEGDNRKPASTASLALASAQRSVDGQLRLTTLEGDTVTITAGAEASVTYAALRGRSPDGRFSARQVSIEASRELSVEVQGDLNDREMAEIRKVVRAFFRELKDAFRGGGFDASDVAGAGAGGGSTLAGFSVHIEARQSMSVVSVVAQPRGGAMPLPVAPAGGDDAGAGAGSSAALPGILGRLLAAARGANVAPEKLERAIEHVFDAFARHLGPDRAQALLAALRQGVRQGISERAPADASPVDVPAEPLPAA